MLLSKNITKRRVLEITFEDFHKFIKILKGGNNWIGKAKSSEMEIEKNSTGAAAAPLESATEEELYTKMKELEKELEFLDIQEEFIKDD